MDNPNLYKSSNSLQTRDANDVLDLYLNVQTWRPGDKVLDVGCGSGDVTVNTLMKRLPEDVGCVMATDISEEMVKYAKTHYFHDMVQYDILDIETKELDPKYQNKYDHVFSFDCMHWIVDQTLGFKNIYNTLKKNGDCIITLVGKNHIFDIYKILAKDPRWEPYMKDYKRYLSPYNDSLNPAADMKKILQSVGFKNIDVQVKHKKHCYYDLRSVKNAAAAVNPFLKRIPIELHEEYLEHYVGLVGELGFIEENLNNNCGEKMIIYSFYCSLVIYASK